MKKLILYLSLAIIIQSAFSQDYQCIKDDASYFFTDGSQYQAIQIDSIASHGDSLVFFNFPNMEMVENTGCYSQYGPSWIGRKMIALPGGDNLFYNMDGQTILIKTMAETGESWACFEFSSGNLIQAKVESIEQMDFLEMTDNVKTITFQAIDSVGNPIAHQVNDMYLLLSENYGLIRTVNFKVFPDLYDYLYSDECQEYELCGIDQPETGTTNLTAAKIFDFDIGDEFHSHNHTYTWSSTTYISNKKTINLVLDKQQIGDDELVYSIKRCGYSEVIFGEPSPSHTISFINDTVDQTYHIGNYPNDYNLNNLPDQVAAIGGEDFYEYYWFDQSNNSDLGRLQKKEFDGYYSEFPHDCIMQALIEINIRNYYIEGLGGPYWQYEDWWHVYLHEIVYFKKGSEEWGEPYICDSLLVGLDKHLGQQCEVSIAPNPMQQWTRITIVNPGRTNHILKLYNTFGKQCGEWQFTSNELILSRRDLPDGIYFYSISDGKKFNQSGKLVIQ